MRTLAAPILRSVVLSAIALSAYAQRSLSQTSDASLQEPQVKVFTAPSGFGVRSGEVKASLSLTEDAYVLVVALDRNGRVHVLLPDSAKSDTIVRRASRRPIPAFSAGGGPEPIGKFGSKSSRAARPLSRNRDDGVVIAIASAKPLQLERIIGNGEWDEDAIASLLFTKIPAVAADALGHELAERDQAFSTDFAPLFTSPNGERTLTFHVYDP